VLWNEPQRLEPILAKYSEKNIDPNTTFKKTITDLPRIHEQDRDKKFKSQF